MNFKAFTGIFLLVLQLTGCTSDVAMDGLQTQYAIPTYIVVTATPILGGRSEAYLLPGDGDSEPDEPTDTPDDDNDDDPVVRPTPTPDQESEEDPGEPPDYAGVVVFENDMPYHRCMPAIVTGAAFDLRVEAIAQSGYSLENCPIVTHEGEDGEEEEVYFQPDQFVQVWWFNEDKEGRIVACIDELCINQVAMCGDRGRQQVLFYPDIFATEYVYLREQGDLPEEEDICHFEEPNPASSDAYVHVPGGSKLGSHIIEYSSMNYEMVINSQVRSATIIVNEDPDYDFANAFLRARPDRIVLLRSTYFEEGIDNHQFDSDPAKVCENAWGGFMTQVERIDPDLLNRVYWQMNNELSVGHSGDLGYAVERARWLTDYTIRCAELAEQHGLRIGGYAFGVGQPEITLLNSEYRRGFERLAAGGHAIVTHDYYGRIPQEGWQGNYPYGWGYYFGRYRTIINMNIPGLRIIIGETGAEHIDQIPNSHPYRYAGLSSQQYVNQLKQIDQVFMMDEEVMFASVFAHGLASSDWYNYDITGETANLLYQYINSTYR